MSGKTLDVYLKGRLIGELHSDNATLEFRYTPSYLASSDAMPLSAAFPLRDQDYGHEVVAPFFSGLLPDGAVRTRLAKYLRVSEKNTFALLEQVGGECAGAVSLFPAGRGPDETTPPTYRVLEQDEAHDVLSALDKRPLLVGEAGVRISGAGAQDKMMVAFVDGKLAIPTDNTPSTHIIKPAIKGLSETVQNEFFCMRLALEVGLPTPAVDIYKIQGQSYYLVERYDRRESSRGLVLRLHQEDFCQALQRPPEFKYENEGGPGLAQCFDLLAMRIRAGVMAGRNRLTLFDGVIFNFLIGNGDAHGKNFSLLYNTNGSEALAPFYDLMCTQVYGDDAFKSKMAMKIGGKYRFKDVKERQFIKLGEALGFKADFVRKRMRGMSEKLLKASSDMADVLVPFPIYAEIRQVITTHSRQVGC